MSFELHFQDAADPVFVIDPLEERFVAANPAGCSLLGYTHGELLETPVSRIHPGELPQLRDFVSRVLSDGHGTTITLTCRTSCGSCVPTEMALHTVERDGRVYLLALIHDRSEHRATQRSHSAGSATGDTLRNT